MSQIVSRPVTTDRRARTSPELLVTVAGICAATRGRTPPANNSGPSIVVIAAIVVAWVVLMVSSGYFL
jgi:hypothetical protein